MEEALVKRIMPHSLEAEQSVIGSMIMDRDAILTASEQLVKDDFYHQQYGILFETITELFNSGAPVDLITLQNRLREKNVPPEISSLEYVGDLVTTVPTSANVKYYAEIVKEKAVLRKLIKINEQIADTCYLGNESLEVILEETEKSIFNLLQSRSNSDYVPIKQVVLNALDKIEIASRTQGNVTGIPTGFVDLDYKLSGLQPSDMILVAARPSMGKTAFVLNIAQYAAFHEDMATAIFSLEMSKEQLVNRLFSLESRVDAQLIRQKRFAPAGDFRYLPFIKATGQGVERTGYRTVTAEPTGRAASGSQTDAFGSARVRSHRAGCRCGYVYLSRRLLQQRFRE